MSKIIIVAGPTASGKTNFSIKLAQNLRVEIINADSMQVFAENPIISAQPTIEEKQDISHHLFGYIRGDEDYTIARWIQDTVNTIKNTSNPTILVGGTGFYLKHLMFGLSPIPDIPVVVRQQARELLSTIGNLEFYQLLMQLDPESASKIDPNNTKKLLRAYEVLKSTGKPIHYWQKHNIKHFPLSSYQLILLLPPRDVIYENCNKRFLEMIDKGVIDEVRNLLKQNYNPLVGVMKSHGVPELKKYLEGEWNLNQAIEKSQQVVRNYAKRQITWFKHQFNHPEINPILVENPNEDFEKTLDLCRNFLK